MQIIVDKLDRTWGLSLQIGLVSGWLSGEGNGLSIITNHYNPQLFPSLKKYVTETDRPVTEIETHEPTLVGPYPATKWVQRSNLENYAVILAHLPWELYPKKKQRWLGRIPSYANTGGNVILRSLIRLMILPWRRAVRTLNRHRDRSAVTAAKQIYIYDDRMRKPVNDFYDRDPELISPVAPVGQGKNVDPENTIIAMGPLEPLQNVKRIIDAFYVFVNRLGTQRRQDWDGRNPMQMWQSGDFTLEIHGKGDGKKYLKDYAESQQLEDQIEFGDWMQIENYDSLLESALAVIDVPLAGDASPLVYHAISLGVPAVHCRHHKGLDTLLSDSELSHKTSSTNADEIASCLLDAVRIPTSSRQPNESLKKALEVESSAQYFLEQFEDEL